MVCAAKSGSHNVDDFFSKVERKFVTADLQERLRKNMNTMNERDCKDLPDYVGMSRSHVSPRHERA